MGKDNNVNLSGCGVYVIKNNSNGKIYIGSSVNCENRFKQHLYHLNKNTHPNRHLQNSYLKNSDFSFNVLFNCHPSKRVSLEHKEIAKQIKKIGANMVYNILKNKYGHISSFDKYRHKFIGFDKCSVCKKFLDEDFEYTDLDNVCNSCKLERYDVLSNIKSRILFRKTIEGLECMDDKTSEQIEFINLYYKDRLMLVQIK